MMREMQRDREQLEQERLELQWERDQIERERIATRAWEDMNNDARAVGNTLQTDEMIAMDLQRQEDERAMHEVQSQEAHQLEHADFLVAIQLQEDIAQEQITPPTRACVVCQETVAISRLPALMSCTHEPQTCADCFANWIASELEGKGWQNINCPETNCRNKLEPAEVRIYATEEVFQK
jgi:hypothetical protein